MGACNSQDGHVDEEEILLRGKQAADSEVNRKAAWLQVQMETQMEEHAGDPEDARQQDPFRVPSETEDHSPKQTNKDAIKRLARALLRGITLEISSSSIAMQQCLAKIDQDLTELRLQDAADGQSGSVKIIPLVRVVEVSRVMPPGARFMEEEFSVRLRLGPGRHGPEALILSLRSAEERDAFMACISASVHHLQGQAAWARKRAMDEESVPSTLVRTVDAIRNPHGLSVLHTAAKKPKKACNLQLPMSKSRNGERPDSGMSARKMDKAVPWELRNGEEDGTNVNLSQ